MTPPKIHPADARWLRHWLRSNLVCVLAICGFLILIGFQSHPPHELQAQTAADVGVASEQTTFAHGRPVPVAPEGWRRTSDGWEHVSTWLPIARPLGEIVLEQEAREPIWVRAGLAKVRGVPPLAFALLQIAAISAIVGIARTEKHEDPVQVVATSRS